MGPGILSVSMKLTASFDNNHLPIRESYVNDDVATYVVAGNCILATFLKFQPWPVLRLPVCPDPSFPLVHAAKQVRVWACIEGSGDQTNYVHVHTYACVCTAVNTCMYTAESLQIVFVSLTSNNTWIPALKGGSHYVIVVRIGPENPSVHTVVVNGNVERPPETLSYDDGGC